MEKLVIGYLYYGKPTENSESFFKIAKNKNIDVIPIDISKQIDDTELAEINNCDLIFNDSGDDSVISLIKNLEEMGKIVVESSKAIHDENKWNFYLKCQKNNIPTPNTILLSCDLEEAKKQLIEFNKWPVILKRVTGTWGEYVKKADDKIQAIEIMKEFWEKGGEKIQIIAQEFINSFSYRVTFIGDKIMQTTIKENNSWKCTGVYARNFKKFEIDEELNEILKKIIKNFNIKICGVDFLKKDNKWFAIEVNSEPALDFFEEEREILIEKIIDLLIDLSKNNLNQMPLQVIPKIRALKKEI